MKTESTLKEKHSMYREVNSKAKANCLLIWTIYEIKHVYFWLQPLIWSIHTNYTPNVFRWVYCHIFTKHAKPSLTHETHSFTDTISHQPNKQNQRDGRGIVGLIHGTCPSTPEIHSQPSKAKPQRKNTNKIEQVHSMLFFSLAV